MPRKKLLVEVEDQNIIFQGLIENIPFDPASVRRFYVDNVFQRSLAHGLGYDGIQSQLLRCTTGGIQKVAPVGTGFEYNDVWSGNAPDAYGTAKTFDSIASRVDIFTWDFACLIKRSLDGTVYQDEFEIPANFHYSYDGTTHSINIKNATPGNVCRYSIIGWW